MEKRGYKIYAWFYQRFLLILVISLMVVAALSYAAYSVAEKTIKKIAFEKSEVEIRYFIRDIDNIFQEAEDMGDQVTNNLILSDLISDKFSLSNYASVTSLKNIRQIQMAILEVNPYVEDVRTYDLNNGICISASRITVLDQAKIQKFREASQNMKRHWIDPGEENMLDGSSNNSRLLMPIRDYHQNFQCLVAVEMKNQMIYDQILNQDQNMMTGIFDSHGQVIFNKKELEEAGIENNTASNVTGYRMEQGKDGWYLVTVENSKINDWKYLMAVPEKLFTFELIQVRKLITLITGLFGVMIIAALYCMGKQLFLPIKSMKKLLADVEDGEDYGTKNEIMLLDYRIRDVIKQLELEKDKNECMKTHLKQQEKELEQYSFYRVIFGEFSDLDLLRAQEKVFGFSGLFYLSFVVELKLEDRLSGQSVGYQKEVCNKIVSGARYILGMLMEENEISHRELAVSHMAGTKIYGVVSMKESSVRDFIRELKTELQFYQNILLQYFHCVSIIGIGCAGAWEELSKSRESGERLLKYQFIVPGNQILSQTDLETGEGDFYPEYYNHKQIMKEGLRNCRSGEVKDTLQQYLEGVKNSRIFFDYEYICKDIINVVYEVLLKRCPDSFEYFRTLTRYFTDFGQLFPSLEEFNRQIVGDLDAIFKNTSDVCYSHNVKRALELIQKEYQKDLSLQEAANTLGLSAPYLSKIFREEVGENFKNYLTKLKMRKARELMEHTELSLQEIALCVGYHDYKHFSVMFKKMSGVTASSYRKSCGR